jgi:hypothetical protein
VQYAWSKVRGLPHADHGQFPHTVGPGHNPFSVVAARPLIAEAGPGSGCDGQYALTAAAPPIRTDRSPRGHGSSVTTDRGAIAMVDTPTPPRQLSEVNRP